MRVENTIGKRHAEQMKRRRAQLEAWEMKQLNREARKQRRGEANAN